WRGIEIAPRADTDYICSTLVYPSPANTHALTGIIANDQRVRECRSATVGGHADLNRPWRRRCGLEDSRNEIVADVRRTRNDKGQAAGAIGRGRVRRAVILVKPRRERRKRRAPPAADR